MGISCGCELDVLSMQKTYFFRKPPPRNGPRIHIQEEHDIPNQCFREALGDSRCLFNHRWWNLWSDLILTKCAVCGMRNSLLLWNKQRRGESFRLEFMWNQGYVDVYRLLSTGISYPKPIVYLESFEKEYNLIDTHVAIELHIYPSTLQGGSPLYHRPYQAWCMVDIGRVFIGFTANITGRLHLLQICQDCQAAVGVTSCYTSCYNHGNNLHRLGYKPLNCCALMYITSTYQISEWDISPFTSFMTSISDSWNLTIATIVTD